MHAFALIDAGREAYLGELFAFLRIPSVTSDRCGAEQCAAFLATLMEKSGIATAIYPTPGNPIVYGEIRGRSDDPTVLFYGHYDVQEPGDRALWSSEPFEPVIRDGRIFGRGTADDKAQLFANIKGVEAYQRAHGHLPGTLKFLYEGEEEASSVHLHDFIVRHRDLLRSDIMLGSDSHMHESGAPVLFLGAKGMLFVEVQVTCANRDLHSMRAAAVPNPAWRLVALLRTLKGEDGHVTIEGFYDDVVPPSPAALAAAERVPYDRAAIMRDLGVSALVHNRTGDHYYYNSFFEPTFNIAGLAAGFVGHGKKTVLPGTATAKADIRLVPNQTPERTLELLRAHLHRHGFSDVTLRILGQAYPRRGPLDTPYVAIAQDAVREVWGQEPLLYPNVFGTNPGWMFTRNLGLDFIEIPFAAADENSHAPDENFPVEHLYAGMKTTAAILGQLAQPNAG